MDKHKNEIEECKRLTKSIPIISYNLLTSNDWKIEKITPEGDHVSHMYFSESQEKIFKITGTINYPAMKLINFLYENIESMPSWNDHVEESYIINVIDENTDVIYQASTSFGGGLIGARDFVLLRHREQRESYFICSNVSVNLSSHPPRDSYTRGENGISCFAAKSLENDENKCQLTWILDAKMKGWIPQKIVEMSVSVGLVRFMKSLRLRVSKITD